MSKPRVTKKQRIVMELILEGNQTVDGVIESWLDTDQLMDRLPYIASKQAIQCSLRILEGHGLIKRLPRELRRERWRTPLMPLDAGFELFGRRPISTKEYEDRIETTIDDIVEIEFL